MKTNKINFKEKKYIMPLLVLPFILFTGYQITSFIDNDDSNVEERQAELSTSLGEVKDSIMTKNDAYNEFYKARESRTMISNLQEETDSTLYYTETLNEKEKRYIDSLEDARKKELERTRKKSNENKSYYNPKDNQSTQIDEDERDYQRSLEIIKMINGDGEESTNKVKEKKQEEDPLKLMKEQILLMDSLENASNPEYKSQKEAQERLRRDREKREEFLNSTLSVRKAGVNDAFNHISKKKPSNLIKAVIDENIKGYLGSRIRIRLLEDVFVGETKMPKGTILYALISGFGLQRVNLNIVSVILDGEIYPINLSIYDNDGMKGLYVPRSAFREMMREIGSNTNYLQGSSMNESQSFYTSLITGVLNSASQTIAKVIRSNKVRLKYNSYVFLIDEKQLKNRKK